jgi:hypothetical protein
MSEYLILKQKSLNMITNLMIYLTHCHLSPTRSYKHVGHYYELSPSNFKLTNIMTQGSHTHNTHTIVHASPRPFPTSRAATADIPRHGHGRRANAALYRKFHHIALAATCTTDFTISPCRHSQIFIPPLCRRLQALTSPGGSRGGSLFCTPSGGFADDDRKCSISNIEKSYLNLVLFDSNTQGRELAFFPAPLLKLTLRGAPPGPRRQPGPCPRNAGRVDAAQRLQKSSLVMAKNETSLLWALSAAPSLGQRGICTARP